jgi:quercetin dioxygenase-like cupin family protein
MRLYVLRIFVEAVVLFAKTLTVQSRNDMKPVGVARLLGGIAIAALLALGGGAQAHETGHDDDHHDGHQSAQVAEGKLTATSTLLLESSTHGDGVPIVYPKGTPLVTVRITEVPPGVIIPKHRHQIPLIVYMLEGDLTLHIDNGTVRVAKQGEAFIEAWNWHYGQNATDKTVRLLAVYPGEVGTPLSIRPPADPSPAQQPPAQQQTQTPTPAPQSAQ